VVACTTEIRTTGAEYMPEEYSAPIYAKIALDLAGKIAGGELTEGQRLSGRSLLAAQYRVSPETIRRAVQLLEDTNIVAVFAGSGVVIASRAEAIKDTERHRVIAGVHSIRDEIKRLLKEKAAIEEKLNVMVERLEEMAERLQNIRPIYPYEIVVSVQSPLIGKSINEAKFWQNTGATIVAIRRDEQIIYSPGPYAVFQPGDLLFVTGDPGVDQRVASFLSEP
jgi:K+/H+ antiporter YhaU regulatory subunit KhtT